MTARYYIDALEKMNSAEAEDASFKLETSDIDYRHALKKREEYDDNSRLGAELVHAVKALCDPESNEDEIAPAKTVLEDYAAKTANIAERCKKRADRIKLAEIRTSYDEYRFQTYIADAESTKTIAEEAVMFAAIGSLDKVEADKLKVRVNEVAAGYHEKFAHVVQQCNAYQEAFTKAMATAERLLA